MSRFRTGDRVQVISPHRWKGGRFNEVVVGDMGTVLDPYRGDESYVDQFSYVRVDASGVKTRIDNDCLALATGPTDQELAEVYQSLGVTTPLGQCCVDMSSHLDQHLTCEDGHDAWSCDTTLVTADDGIGILVRDGGSSYILIAYCPWCGVKL